MFDRIAVINLDRRPERLLAFRSRLPMDWPFRPVERVPAFDGSTVHRSEIPDWYAPDNKEKYRGAWGCFQSHLGIWKDALERGLESLLIFEDDAVFCPAFTPRVMRFLESVPDDWDQIYFGGQHLHNDTMPPVQINAEVLRGRNVNRTHAYAIRRPMMEFLVALLDRPWPRQMPVNYYNFDYQLGKTHGERNAYCPVKWLCGQAAGRSDVSENVKFCSPLWWKEFHFQREAVPC